MMDNERANENQVETDADAAERDSVAARREVLKRLGIYSAVTAPVLLGMLQSEKAVAQTGPGIPGGGGTTPGGSVVF